MCGVHKYSFQQSRMKSERGVAVMTSANIFSVPTFVDNVHYSFRPLRTVKIPENIGKMEKDSTGVGPQKINKVK